MPPSDNARPEFSSRRCVLEYCVGRAVRPEPSPLRDLLMPLFGARRNSEFALARIRCHQSFGVKPMPPENRFQLAIAGNTAAASHPSAGYGLVRLHRSIT